MKRRELLALLSAGTAGVFLPWRGAQASGAKLHGYLRTNWSRDPYSLGSYSYVAKGAKQSDREILGAPIGSKIYFAGEAVHPDHNSTVHAAYESGLIAAKRIGRKTKGRIAIVGAGISGLAAAQILAKNGRSVTVFEARNRIGGRVWTSNALGLPLDLGASWIHGTRGNPVTKLARQVGAKMVVTDETYIVRGAGGRIMEDDDIPEWLENVTTIQHNAGADGRDLNHAAYFNQEEYGGDEVIFPQGYESILGTFRGKYEIRKSEKVTAIEHDGSGVVIVSNGNKTAFDTVLVTLPLGVLKNNSVRFGPSLPVDKQKAISRLGMGTLDKLYLHYDRPFWDENTTWILTPENGLPRGHFNQWLNLYKYLKEPIIMGFNGGSAAVELSGMSDEKIVLMAQKTLLNSY